MQKESITDRAKALKIFEENLAKEIDFNNFDEFAQAVIFSKESYLLGYMDAKKIPLRNFGKILDLVNSRIEKFPPELKERGNEIAYYESIRKTIKGIERHLYPLEPFDC
jgi:hypothetical protein